MRTFTSQPLRSNNFIYSKNKQQQQQKQLWLGRQSVAPHSWGLLAECKWRKIQFSLRGWSLGFDHAQEVYGQRLGEAQKQVSRTHVMQNKGYKTFVRLTWHFLTSFQKSHTASFMYCVPTQNTKIPTFYLFLLFFSLTKTQNLYYNFKLKLWSDIFNFNQSIHG